MYVCVCAHRFFVIPNMWCVCAGSLSSLMCVCACSVVSTVCVCLCRFFIIPNVCVCMLSHVNCVCVHTLSSVNCMCVCVCVCREDQPGQKAGSSSSPACIRVHAQSCQVYVCRFFIIPNVCVYACSIMSTVCAHAQSCQLCVCACTRSVVSSVCVCVCVCVCAERTSLDEKQVLHHP